jgi:tRNA_anti-like
MKSRKDITLVLVFGLWSAMVLGCASFRKAMDAKHAEREGPGVSISAKDLYRAYESNEAQADNLYQGKIVIVTGTVGTTSTPEQGMGRPAIVLVDERNKPIVNCFGFSADAREAIAKLKPGDKVTVKGKCLGRIATAEPALEDSALQ